MFYFFYYYSWWLRRTSVLVMWIGTKHKGVDSVACAGGKQTEHECIECNGKMSLWICEMMLCLSNIFGNFRPWWIDYDRHRRWASCSMLRQVILKCFFLFRYCVLSSALTSICFESFFQWLGILCVYTRLVHQPSISIKFKNDIKNDGNKL